MARVLASFVRSLQSGDSRYDRFINGDRAAFSTQQQLGLQLFRGKVNCTACHVGPNCTDEALHNTGVAWRDGNFADEGAGQGRFKTPTLREVARTAPYMHDAGGRANPSLDPEIPYGPNMRSCGVPAPDERYISPRSLLNTDLRPKSVLRSARETLPFTQ